MRKFPVAAFECSTAVLHHPCESFVAHVYLKDSTLTLKTYVAMNSRRIERLSHTERILPLPRMRFRLSSVRSS